MRRIMLLGTFLLGLLASPALGEPIKFQEFQCLTPKLQATAGTSFNLNFVPFETIFVCGAIVSVDGDSTFDLTTLGFQGPGVLAQSCALATREEPYQLFSPILGDLNLFEAYGKIEAFMPLVNGQADETVTVDGGPPKQECRMPPRGPANPGAVGFSYLEVGVVEAQTTGVCRRIRSRISPEPL